MKTFKEYVLVDEHQHDSFDKAYACYMMYVGRQSRKGSQKVKVRIEDCRQVYKEMQFQGTASQAQDRATKIVRNAIDQHTDGTINTLIENKDNDSVRAVTQCMLQSNPLKRPQHHAPSQEPAKKIASSAARDTIKINIDLLSTGNATVGSLEINELQALAHNASSAEAPSDEDEHHNRKLVVPSQPPNLTGLQSILFRFVAERLPKFKKLHRVHKKDVYVAASMVAHLEMEDAHRVFGPAVISELAPLVVDEQFADPDEALKSTLKTITDAARDSNGYLDAQRVQLLAAVRLGELASNALEGKPTDDRERRVFEIVRYLAKLSEPQVVARPKETESMTVKTWHQVFDLMFDGTYISVLTGESGLSASREEREQHEQEHGGAPPPLMPRKVDFLLVASVDKEHKLLHVELVDYEHKGPGASNDDVAVQLRKSIRHNHAILSRHPWRKELVFLDIKGYTGRVVHMVEHDGVHICATLCEDLKLPTNAAELSQFMNGRALATLERIR
ncbi:hypothetical protein BGZ89_005913, partial [Linnemannia elongata]